MQDEFINEEDMKTATVKTSPALFSAIELAAKHMVARELDELKFVLPGTKKVSLLLVKKGSKAETSRVSDKAALLGVEYDVVGQTFLLARR